jgi:tRNA(Ile)-lysidine synthase
LATIAWLSDTPGTDPVDAGQLVEEALRRALRGAVAPGRVFVGYSGGMDSTVLLHAAIAASPVPVTAVHANHGLDPQAGRWQAHCERVCAQWGVGLESREVSVGHGNVEAAARAARYGFFESVLSASDLLLLAHHQDDQAETVMLRMVQGRGLIGIPSARRLGAGELRRPFLELPRQVLAEYADGLALDWVEDPGNADEGLDRNYLRSRVLPSLRRRWPGFAGQMQVLLDQRASTEQMLLARVDGDFESIAVGELLCGDGGSGAELLGIWLSSLGAALPSRGALASFVAQLGSAADRQPELKLAQGSLRRYRGRVYRVADPPALAPSYELIPPGELRLPHGTVTVCEAHGGGFQLHGPLKVMFRGPEGAGHIRCRGHRRSIKKLLQDAGLPPWKRLTYPLLEDADGVAAVPGIAERDPDPDPDPDPPSGGTRWVARWTAHSIR